MRVRSCLANGPGDSVPVAAHDPSASDPSGAGPCTGTAVPFSVVEKYRRRNFFGQLAQIQSSGQRFALGPGATLAAELENVRQFASRSTARVHRAARPLPLPAEEGLLAAGRGADPPHRSRLAVHESPITTHESRISNWLCRDWKSPQRDENKRTGPILIGHNSRVWRAHFGRCEMRVAGAKRCCSRCRASRMTAQGGAEAARRISGRSSWERHSPEWRLAPRLARATTCAKVRAAHAPTERR